jgi:hypothetical protein
MVCRVPSRMRFADPPFWPALESYLSDHAHVARQDCSTQHEAPANQSPRQQHNDNSSCLALGGHLVGMLRDDLLQPTATACISRTRLGTA